MFKCILYSHTITCEQARRKGKEEGGLCKQALDFSLLLLSVNLDQDLCKMIIFTIVLCCFVHCMAESIRQQMNQITEPNKMNMKLS